MSIKLKWKLSSFETCSTPTPKKEWSTLMTPAFCLPRCHAYASVCWAEPQKNCAKWQSWSLLSVFPLLICLPLFLSTLYLPSSLLRHFVIVSGLFKLCVNMQKCKLLFALFISLPLSLCVYLAILLMNICMSIIVSANAMRIDVKRLLSLWPLCFSGPTTWPAFHNCPPTNSSYKSLTFLGARWSSHLSLSSPFLPLSIFAFLAIYLMRFAISSLHFGPS